MADGRLNPVERRTRCGLKKLSSRKLADEDCESFRPRLWPRHLGCSRSADALRRTRTSQPANPIAVNFALDKCQQIEPNLYKCPAVDQPICTPQFNRTNVNCVRIGPKGSVFVQRGGITP